MIDRILAHVAPILRSGPITPVDDIAACPASPALRWRFDGIEPIRSNVLPARRGLSES
jgi:diaminohydroxyphosphoribosylaminopyrimidine deaminase/5-amino-6-(5-phosphoribosylamino)uracil reductase